MAKIVSRKNKDWLTEVKPKIRPFHIKVDIAVNTALVELNCDLVNKLLTNFKNPYFGKSLLAKINGVIISIFY